MADFKVAFSKVCETFGLKELSEYQKQSTINIVEKRSDVFVCGYNFQSTGAYYIRRFSTNKSYARTSQLFTKKWNIFSQFE